MPTDLKDLISLISTGSLGTFLLVVLWAGYTKKWVFGWVYEAEKQRAEEWRQVAYAGNVVLGKAVKGLDTTVSIMKGASE